MMLEKWQNLSSKFVMYQWMGTLDIVGNEVSSAKKPLYCVIGGTCSNKSGLFECVWWVFNILGKTCTLCLLES